MWMGQQKRHITILNFLKKILEDISQFWYPCFGLLVTSRLGFKARVGSLIRTWQRRTCYTFHESHLWCNTCWPLDDQHGIWTDLSHIPPIRHWWGSNKQMPQVNALPTELCWLCFSMCYHKLPVRISHSRGISRILWGVNPPGGGTNLRFCQIFQKTAIKWENFGPQGGGSYRRAPLLLDLPLHSSKINFKYHRSLAKNMAQRNLNFALVILETFHCFKILTRELYVY